jgi:hypothetical protein
MTHCRHVLTPALTYDKGNGLIKRMRVGEWKNESPTLPKWNPKWIPILVVGMWVSLGVLEL